MNYICLCDTNRRAECFRVDRNLGSCRHCLSHGRCVQGNLNDRFDFVCLCPRCHFGSICQFNTALLSFTLESLITNDIFSPRPSVRIMSICFYTLLILVLLCLGLVNNFFSGVTFRRSKPRLVGTGYYLLCNSFFAQVSLLCLSIKMLLLITNITSMIDSIVVNKVICKTITFFLSTNTRITYWLTALVTVERAYVVIYPRETRLKKPSTSKYLIGTILFLSIASHWHELFYYDVVEDPKNILRGKSAFIFGSVR